MLTIYFLHPIHPVASFTLHASDPTQHRLHFNQPVYTETNRVCTIIHCAASFSLIMGVGYSISVHSLACKTRCLKSLYLELVTHTLSNQMQQYQTKLGQQGKCCSVLTWYKSCGWQVSQRFESIAQLWCKYFRIGQPTWTRARSFLVAWFSCQVNSLILWSFVDQWLILDYFDLYSKVFQPNQTQQLLFLLCFVFSFCCWQVCLHSHGDSLSLSVTLCNSEGLQNMMISLHSLSGIFYPGSKIVSIVTGTK